MGILGSGVYTAYLQARGGTPVLVELGWSELSFGRRIDEVTDATVEIPTEGLAGNEAACGYLSDANPWEHEIAIYRTSRGASELAWAGPLLAVTFTPRSITLFARDVAAWFERRLLRTSRSFAATDLATIYQQYVDDALVEDNSMGIVVAATATGITGDRIVLGTNLSVAADELAELARTGLDWTAIGRTIVVGGVETPTDALATLTEDLLDAESVEIRGQEAASRVTVRGASQEIPDDPVVGEAGGIDATLGLVERLYDEHSIRDVASADVAAQTRLDMLLPCPAYVQGTLVPETPIAFADLVPGARVHLALTVGCKTIDETMRLHAIDVQCTASDRGVSEDIAAVFVPLGTVT